MFCHERQTCPIGPFVCPYVRVTQEEEDNKLHATSLVRQRRHGYVSEQGIGHPCLALSTIRFFIPLIAVTVLLYTERDRK